MSNIIAVITNFIIGTISSLGYSGIALLMAIESAAIPLPSEVIMPFSGFLVSEGRFTLLGISLAGGIGSIFGSLATYALGYFGGRKFIAKYGRYVLLSEHDLMLAEKFFARFGWWATFASRMLPGMRTYISIPAGIAKMRLWSFTLACLVGSFIWSLALGYIGLKFGENWESLKIYFHKAEWAIGILLLAGAIWWIRRHLKNRVK